MLQSKLGKGRIQHVIGDTCNTVPAFFSSPNEKKCDLIHGSSFCPSDMKDLIRHLRPNGIVTATALNSLQDNNVYFGESAQWRQLLQEGCITEISCWKELQRTLEESYVFAKKGSHLEHEFCVAVNTGKCSSQRDNGTSVDHDVDFGQFCTMSRIVAIPH